MGIQTVRGSRRLRVRPFEFQSSQ